jgi:hypothetical protein
MNKYVCGVDANQGEIVQAFEKMGCQVLDLTRVGGGCTDLLVYPGMSDLYLVEVKVPGGKLNKKQHEFHDDWPCWIVSSVDEVIPLVKEWREKWTTGQ